MRGCIDVGCREWVHPGVLGTCWGSEAAAKHAAEDRGLDPSAVQEKDSRMTLCDVVGALGCEEHIWDEYLSVYPVERGARWPEDCRRVVVYVVTGGSEGLYMHVESVNAKDERQLLILGKTLDSSPDRWTEAWLSASRIARRLGA